MFTYPELTTVEHLGGRWYLTPSGLYYPSITTVLSGTEPPELTASLQRWRDSIGHREADEITTRAARHGTQVHLLAERHLKGQEVLAPIDGQPVPPTVIGAFNALRLKLRQIDEVWGQEVALYSDALQVAGRTDVVGRYQGVPAIIDFKTSSRVKGPQDVEAYRLQLCFYGKAHNEVHGTDIRDGVILMSSELGFPQEFHVKLDAHLDALKVRIATFWQKAINTTFNMENV